MKTYKVDLVRGGMGLVQISEKKQDDGEAYWQYVGAFQPERAAIYIVLAITNSTDLAFARADRFTRHFINGRKCFPRVITERDVFDWLGRQVAAAL